MKKWIIPIVTLIILVGGVAAGIFLVRESTEFREKAAPATTLTFSTLNQTVDVGDTFIVSVQVNSGENQLDGVQMAINYDSSILQADSITKGNFFGESANTTSARILPSQGLIDFTVFLPLGSTQVQGTGTVAIITFSALTEGTSTLSFIDEITYSLDGQQRTAETLVTELGEAGSVLASTTPITITVLAAGSQPTATSTPTEGAGDGEEPTATPTTILTSTPTPSPTPTDSSGVGGTELPTSTPTPTTAPVNTATPTPTSALIAQNLTTPTNTPAQLLDSGFEDYTIVYLIVGSMSLLLSGALIFSTKN